MAISYFCGKDVHTNMPLGNVFQQVVEIKEGDDTQMTIK